MDPASREEAASALLRSMDLLRAGGASSIIAHFEDIYESAFESLGFRRVFARMRMEAPTKRNVAPINVKLQPPEEDEVLGLTKFLMDVYEGHMEQQYGIHTGPEEEWRGYVAGLFKGDSGQFMPDASQVALERSEEHTSELQSRGHLVCRLLLEKKKNKHMSKQKPLQRRYAGGGKSGQPSVFAGACTRPHVPREPLDVSDAGVRESHGEFGARQP